MNRAGPSDAAPDEFEGARPVRNGRAGLLFFGLANQTDVFLFDKNSRLNVFWVDNVGAWNGLLVREIPC